METRSQIVSVVVATLLFVPVLKADSDSQIPMTLRAPVTFGLWDEKTDEAPLGKRSRVVVMAAPRPGRLGSYILYDAPGPGYFRLRDQFDTLSLDMLK